MMYMVLFRDSEKMIIK